MAQRIPLPLTLSCFSKIQIGFTSLVPAHPVVPDKGPLNVCVCVCVCDRMFDVPINQFIAIAILFIYPPKGH